MQLTIDSVHLFSIGILFTSIIVAMIMESVMGLSETDIQCKPLLNSHHLNQYSR